MGRAVEKKRCKRRAKYVTRIRRSIREAEKRLYDDVHLTRLFLSRGRAVTPFSKSACRKFASAHVLAIASCLPGKYRLPINFLRTSLKYSSHVLLDYRNSLAGVQLESFLGEPFKFASLCSRSAFNSDHCTLSLIHTTGFPYSIQQASSDLSFIPPSHSAYSYPPSGIPLAIFCVEKVIGVIFKSMVLGTQLFSFIRDSSQTLSRYRGFPFIC